MYLWFLWREAVRSISTSRRWNGTSSQGYPQRTHLYTLVERLVLPKNTTIHPPARALTRLLDSEWSALHLTMYRYISDSFFCCCFCRLLSKEFVLLKCLGKYFPFECTVGMNGRVWINSTSTPHTIAIANAISNSEYMTNNQIETMVKQLVKGIQS